MPPATTPDRKSNFAKDAESLPAGTPTPGVTVAAGSLFSSRADVAICFAFEGEGKPALIQPGKTRTVSTGPAKAIERVMREESFKGKRKEILLRHSSGRLPAKRYMVVGLGKRATCTLDLLREGCGLAARRAAGVKARRVSLALPPIDTAKDPRTLAEAAAEGIALGSYRMVKYMTGDDSAPITLKSVEILVPKEALASARSGAATGSIRAAATTLARDLVNEPAGVLTPMRMAGVARRVAKAHGLAIKVIDRAGLAKMGMGAILGVASGSVEQPCLIHLVYRPDGERGRRGRLPKLALVGKGLTFDSGGLSLKTAGGMETMKLDKAGASAVLGVMSALSVLKPQVEVHGIMGMTENMPGGAAIKPGDVLRTMSGKTIEVLNTDAEGRLVLADALGYAQQQKVEQIIDLATLTGACMVALGPVSTGVFGTDQRMVDRFLECAWRAGERMWQLPLYEEYADQLRSEIADVKNTGNRYGGAITAALFLKTFVNEKVPWIHLDIAGPAFLESEQGCMRKGATGAGVRTLLNYILSLSGTS
jgi:leucyl aminopeptidase